MRKLQITGVLLLVLHGAPAPLPAADCKMSDRVDQCVNPLNGLTVAEAPNPDQRTTAAAAAVRERLQQFVTGLGLQSSTAQTAVTDFLARFAIAAETGAIGDDDIGLGFALSRPVDLGIGDYKLQAALRDAKVYEPLRAAIPEDRRAQTLAKLEPRLDDFSDVSLSFAWGLNAKVGSNLFVGRSFDPADDEFSRIYQRIFELSSMQSSRRAAVLATQNFLDGWTDENNEHLDYDEDTLLSEFQSRLGVRDFALLMSLLREQAAAITRSDSELRALETEAGIGRFAELVNNLPQFIVTAGANIRDEVAGPDEYNVHLTFEIPLDANLNDYLEFKSSRCAVIDSYDCWQNFRRTELPTNALLSGARINLGVAYRRSDSYRISIGEGDDLLELSLAGKDGLDVVARYGAYLGFVGRDPNATRLDASLTYQKMFGDGTRNDRLVTGVSMTRQLIGGAALVVGATYANKPEFRKEAAHDLGANIGLVYRFIDG